MTQPPSAAERQGSAAGSSPPCRGDTSPGSCAPDGRRLPPQEAEFERLPQGMLLTKRSDLSAVQREQLVQLLREHDDLFARSLTDLGEYRGDVGPFRIDLIHDRPIWQRPWNHSAAEYEVMDQKCGELAGANIIETSRSSKYAMNSVMPVKKDANGQFTETRFCQDARRTNAATMPDPYSPPLPEELFQRIGSARWLTKADCRAAFLQIPILPEHRERTSFWWRRDLMQYRRMVYGLRNATAHFQRVMDFHIRQHGLQDFVCAYVDDLLIFSNTFEEHCEHLRRVFAMLRAINIRLHPEKTMVASDCVEFLGFMVSADGMGPTRAKVAAFLALTSPTSATALKTILGMYGYYRDLVHHYADIVAGITPLTSKNVVWRSDTWRPEHQAVLDELKRIYSEEGLVLRRVHPDRPLILHTDFSGVGISGVLGQLDDQSREYMCACISRSLNVHERKYTSYKGELLAVVWAVKLLHSYLSSRPFTVVTDHAPLLWLMTTSEGLTPQYARWALTLQAYDFDVVHRPGHLHQNADALSRSPLPSAHDGSGARLDEEDDPVRPPPALVAYPGVEWPSFAFRRRLPTAAAVLAARFALSPSTASPASVISYAASLAPVALLPAYTVVAAIPEHIRCLSLHAVEASSATSSLVVSAGELADPVPDPVPPAMRRATMQVRLERPALRAIVPVSALPLRLRVPDQAVVGINTALVQHGLFPVALGGDGVAVLELPGGLCSGLLACLQLGLRVRRYIPLSGDPTSQAAAAALQPYVVRQYGGLLAAGAWDEGLRAPACSATELVQWAVSDAGAEALGLLTQGQWLVMGSWAGDVGWSAQLYVSLLGAVQSSMRAAGVPPPAFLLEGPPCTLEAAEAAGLPLGYPATVDAVQTGAVLHRLSSIYTNLANPAHLAYCLRRLPPPADATLASRLPDGWFPAPATQPLPSPYAPLEVPGVPWVALPPLALIGTPPLLQGANRVPAVPDAALVAALAGFPPLPQHPSLPALLPRQPPPPVLTAALASCLALHRAFVTPHDLQPLQPRHVAEPARPLGGVSSDVDALEASFSVDTQLGSGLAAAAALEAAAAAHDAAWLTVLACDVLVQRTRGSAVVEATTAVVQEETAAAGSDPDVWGDAEAMAVIRAPLSGRVPPGEAAGASSARVLRRASHYRWTGSQLLRMMADGSTRVCPPPADRMDLTQRTHAVAHLGVRRTLALLQLGYWWHGMRSTVRQVVGSCKLCDMCNSSGSSRPVQLQPLAIKGMFYRWGMDLAGPLPPTKPHGFTYVMVCVEHFTKHAEFLPLRDKTADETARGLLEVIARFSAPAEVVTDQGGEFEGAFSRLLEQCYVDHRPTSAYHPQANGAAERLVQVLKSALRKYCAESGSPETWDQHLPWLALAYRCSPQASTKLAPYTLMYGVPPVVPPAVRERFQAELAFTGNAGEQVYARALVERAALLQRHAPAAAGNLLIAQHRDTRRYALVRSGLWRPPQLQFATGDYVYVRRQNPSNTLQPPVREAVLRVESVGPLGVAVLIGRDGTRIRRRVEQLVPCHLPDLDPIVDPRLMRPAADHACQVCASPRDGGKMLLCDACGTGWHLYCLVPPLSQVPEGSWVCPECVQLQREAPAGPAPPQPEPTAVLFPNAATRRRDDEAAALDGRRIVRMVSKGRGRGREEQLGVLRYRGGLARPHYFYAEWDGGFAEAVGLPAAKRMLMPEQTSTRKKGR
ncbi:hypothetical protein Agub_g1791 [Astrephomene gubernaculifera]|uniref:Reverse transcriptase n=1 Tax=Astrephomene gubernaculifera TaxID=47775 RepID=A0AAD3DIR8_9CHLO|nr:hypothetical protein Agub_g1791 [Astrephomene gubernaculifera]